MILRVLCAVFIAAGLLRPSIANSAIRRDLREADVFAVTANQTLARQEEIADRLQEKLLGNILTLEICECKPASGSPNGLTCEKEGWFISGFEQAGRWASGGGSVPLSRAVCCRPCLPTDIPGGSGTTAVAIISMGCHPSSNKGSEVLKCESSGGSLVTGWSAANRIPDARQYYYPTGPVQCCTPSLLLSNGDARPLQRCDCVEKEGVNCGGAETHRFLSGYTRWGGDRTVVVPPLNNLVPLAPSMCCKTCVSDTVIPAGSCFDLNFCSGHGACNLGACECVAGYGGADCSHRVQWDPSGLSQLGIAMIVLSSVAVACLLLVIMIKIGQYCVDETGEEGDEGSEEGDELREPLIAGLGSDDEGSVGSEDSSCDEDELMPPPISRRPPVEEAVGGGIPVTPEEQAAANQAARQDEQTVVNVNESTTQESTETPQSVRPETFEISQDASDHASESTFDDEAAEQEARHAANVQADQAVIHDIRQAQQTITDARMGEAPEDAKEEKSLKEERDRGGLPGVICSVCLNRPVQVAVVPCGHMCMCRRCSRRLGTCPVCRLKIIRRQRVFLGG